MQLAMNSLEGYFPWLSPTIQLENSGFITDGRNFFWTSSGVRSAFGVREVKTKRGFSLPAFCEKPTITGKDQAGRVFSGGTVRTLAGEVIHTLGRVVEDDLPCVYPWSESQVGCDTVYSHPCFCMYKVDEAGEWSSINNPSNTSPIYASASFCNRLFILLEDTVAWSAIDDPCDFNFGRETGAGFQSLNLACYGKPLGMLSLGQRLYIFTSKGTMVATPDSGITYPVDNTAVVGAMLFSWDTVDTTVPACTALGIAALGENNAVWMTASGLYTFGEGGVAAWQPELGSWLSNGQRCLPSDICLTYLPDLAALQINYKWGSSLLFQLDLNKLGRLDGSYDTVGCVDKQLYALSCGRLLQLDDKSVTSDTFVVTSSLRLPMLNVADRQRREFVTELVEVYHGPDECEVAAGQQGLSISHAANDKGEKEPSLPLQQHCVSTVSSSFGTCLTGLYHRLTLSGRFNVAGFSLQGRNGGLSR